MNVMNNGLIWIFALPNSPSDVTLNIVDFLVVPGSKVSENSAIVEVEGAKSIFEIEANASGFIYFIVEKNEEVKVGMPIAVISHQPINNLSEIVVPPSTTHVERNETESVSDTGLIYTKKAKVFQNRVQLDEKQLQDQAVISLVQERYLKRFFTSRIYAERSVTTKPRKILMMGGGTGADIAYDILDSEQREMIVGVADPKFNILEGRGVPLVTSFEESELLSFIETESVDTLLISHNNMKNRVSFLSFARSNGLKLLNLKSPKAHISDSSDLGQGVFACDFSRIGPETFLGDNIFLSAYVNIEHHCVIGDNTTFGPGVFLSGSVFVGPNCVFGSAIAIEPGVMIGENSTIASGSILTRNIPPNSVVKANNRTIIRPQ